MLIIDGPNGPSTIAKLPYSVPICFYVVCMYISLYVHVLIQCILYMYASFVLIADGPDGPSTIA